LNAIKDLYTVTKFIAQHPLSANRRTRMIFNFFCWQIGARLLNKKVVVPWVDDSQFVIGPGETGLTGNLYAGFMEYEDMLFLLHALRPSNIFVDVGANIGAFTILASKVVKSRTIAFEPLPETARRLKDQVEVNRIESIVEIRNLGIGGEQGTLSFTNNNDTVNKVNLAGDSKNTTRVDVSTLDVELTENARYFLKIDVEGFEYFVIEGASRLLSSGSVAAIIIELNGRGEEFGHSNEEIHQKLKSFNLQPVAYDPVNRSLTRLNGYNQGGGNTIYVRDIEEIAALCSSAPRRTVHTANGIKI
jgi:FkbM family methyltransferase